MPNDGNVVPSVHPFLCEDDGTFRTVCRKNTGADGNRSQTGDNNTVFCNNGQETSAMPGH